MRRAGIWGIGLLALVALGPPVVARLAGLGPDPSVLPPRGASVAIGGDLALNVRELGSGTPVVLVHGLPSNVSDWAELPAALAALGHRVIAYDRVGYGWSSRAPVAGDAYTYASNARELLALLDALAIERAALVGWSYGGAVVQEAALRAPERGSHLVLVGAVGPASGAGNDDWVERLAHSPLGVPVFRWAASFPPLIRAVTRDAVAVAFSGEAHLPAGWVDRTLAQMALPGTLEAWVAEGRRAEPAALRPESIAAPALVVHGDDDRSVPVEIGRDLARRLPRAELWVVPGGSHMLPVTHAGPLAQRIHAFLAAP
jgi:pimeloyl-ACP methyl ester carboxylesterase